MTKTIINNMTDYQNKQERLKSCIVFLILNIVKMLSMCFQIGYNTHI